MASKKQGGLGGGEGCNMKRRAFRNKMERGKLGMCVNKRGKGGIKEKDTPTSTNHDAKGGRNRGGRAIGTGHARGGGQKIKTS